MITREQIEKHCENGLLWAKLDRDYQSRHLDYILPAGTIVQVGLYKRYIGDLYLDGMYIDGCFPYDAATLLETDE